MAAAFLLIAYGLMWGLPNLYDFAQDSVVPQGNLAQVRASFEKVTAFRYPPFHFMLLRACFLPARGLLQVSSFGENPKVASTLFILTARLVSVAMALGVLGLIYAIGRRLWDERTGLRGGAAVRPLASDALLRQEREPRHPLRLLARARAVLLRADPAGEPPARLSLARPLGRAGGVHQGPGVRIHSADARRALLSPAREAQTAAARVPAASVALRGAGGARFRGSLRGDPQHPLRPGRILAARQRGHRAGIRRLAPVLNGGRSGNCACWRRRRCACATRGPWRAWRWRFSGWSSLSGKAASGGRGWRRSSRSSRITCRSSRSSDTSIRALCCRCCWCWRSSRGAAR